MAARLFNPDSKDPFTLSRSRVDNFLECARCFYLTNKLGIARPSTFPFNLNNAVDELLKNEFDFYREKQEPHPIQKENNLNAIPYQHPELDNWRESLRNGIKRIHEPTNLILRGGIDDVWIQCETDQLLVVDYKATSKKGEVNIDADWQISYKKQVEFYQWLFRGNSFDVSDTAYFVYCNGIKDKPEFRNRLEFKVKLIAYTGSDKWVEPTLNAIKECLLRKNPPEPSENCSYCNYVNKSLSI